MNRNGLLGAIARLFTGASAQPAPPTARLRTPSGSLAGRVEGGATATVEVAPPPRASVRITYSPDPDGDPDAGEIVWTWVPYAENDGRGKDRPVLVIGRKDEDHVFAVRLTSKSHEGDRDFLALGSGPWDAQGRPSWVDIDQLYSVHREGMRREASALDLERFSRVADALHARYGWAVED